MKIERMLIVNEISLNGLITYTNSVYEISKKFKGLERKKDDTKVKASTAAKTVFASFLCQYKSLNMLNEVNKQKELNLRMLYQKGEYIPQMHGLRDCIMDTNYEQIRNINESVITKAKENKIFRKNTVDGLSVMAWDGVEFNETTKDIKGLPEREYDNDDVRKYLKYLVAMNVGERGNFIINAKQMLEIEKVTTKTGNERAKTSGETKVFESMWEETEHLVGRVIDVHVFDALFLNQYVVNLIDAANKYFVVRLKDEKREIYKDAKGLFESKEADGKYEIVEIITVKNIKYSKKAKKKDVIKTKVKKEKRDVSSAELGAKVLVDEYKQTKKNSTVDVKVYERVITRKEVWDDCFELTGYKGEARVVRALETSIKNGEENIHEIYVVTNMLDHDVETILKIMHLRWNIENNGFRTLKQRYNINHIFIGELNAINYIVQMIFLVFNLMELYIKYRLKKALTITMMIVAKIFERQLHNDKTLVLLFNPSS